MGRPSSVVADERPRLAVRLTPDGLRQVRGGHPWVFEGSVRSVSGEGQPGDLAVVFDERRRFAGIGLWDPGSPIRVKMLHHGRPRPLDAGFWTERIRTALAARSRFTEASDTGYRVVHGENDGLPGFVADRYADTLVVKLYTAAWLPYLNELVDPLVEATGVVAVVLRAARLVQRDPVWVAGGHSDGDLLRGTLEHEMVRFRENGLWFDADVRTGQKTGYFLDQRANRAAVRDRTQGKEVLDVFCSTGGFTVHAAAGGAASVTSVDVSRPTLQMVEHNLALNHDRPAVRNCRHVSVAGDAFEVLEQMGAAGRSFDLVVVDPPSFAQRQADVPAAERGYRRLTRSALRVLRPGGTLVQASCSSRIPADRFFDLVDSAGRDAGRPLRLRLRTGHDSDHPVGFPEGAYLKAGFWIAERTSVPSRHALGDHQRNHHRVRDQRRG